MFKKETFQFLKYFAGMQLFLKYFAGIPLKFSHLNDKKALNPQ